MTAITTPSVSSDRPRAAVEQGTGPVIIWLRGQQDASTVADLSSILARSIALDDADLVADMSDVVAVDATTVQTLGRARTFLNAHERSLTVRSPSPSAREALEGSDLGDLVARPDGLEDVGPPRR